MIDTIQKEWQAKVALIFLILITIWWFVGPSFAPAADTRFLGDPGSIYFLIAIFGAFWGIRTSNIWGGLQSVMGRALFFFAMGLVGQIFGQFAYGFYPFVLHEFAPYPSLGDLGYFLCIPMYILGIYNLALASGVKVTPQLFLKKPQAIILPAVTLVIGYFLFLSGYVFDWSSPLKIFLDFGYPMGEAIYVSLAVLTYLLSRGVLGGIMKSKILFILFALCFQFVTDYTFLYQSSRGTYSVGGLNDYMYMFSYVLMTLALLQFKTIHDRLRSNTS